MLLKWGGGDGGGGWQWLQVISIGIKPNIQVFKLF